MINIAGIIILMAGFFAPYFSHGRLPSTVLFWIGGLMVFNSGKFIKPEATWAKWARLGIITNIALFAVMLGAFYITIDRSTSTFVHWLSMIPYWLSRPATALGQQIFPFPEIRHPDGSVTFHMGFLRTVIADFLDIATFAVAAVVVGLFRKRRQKSEVS
jgi:hypothetical protein